MHVWIQISSRTEYMVIFIWFWVATSFQWEQIEKDEILKYFFKYFNLPVSPHRRYLSEKKPQQQTPTKNPNLK